MKPVAPEIQEEVEKLVAGTDSQLLDTLGKRTFDYMRYEANPANCLVKARSTKDSFASIAAVGFAVASLPSGLVWRLFMANPAIPKAMALVGLTDRDSAYAVVLAYLASSRAMLSK